MALLKSPFLGLYLLLLVIVDYKGLSDPLPIRTGDLRSQGEDH